MFMASQKQNADVSSQSALIERFEDHIRDKSFPCVGAKSALGRGQMNVMVAGDLRCPRDDRAIYGALRDFAYQFKRNPALFQTFVVLFPTAEPLSEERFEAAMWERIQRLEAFDAEAGEPYDPRVSANPKSENFSLSFAAEAFFVVGMHPGASRKARQFEVPALVFNAHAQFETLRAEGRYETLRESIIERDVALHGTPNPMLARHGELSEARQYSGRTVSESWTCPFHAVHPRAAEERA